MKKFTAFILAMVLAFTLVGCGKSGPQLTQNTTEENTFDEILLFDNEYCSCSVVNIYPNGNCGCDIRVSCTNKTPDTMIGFMNDSQLANENINGAPMEPSFLVTVEPGTTELSTIRFFTADLEKNNINPDDIKTICFDMIVFNWDNWSANPYVNGEFTLEY